MKKKHTNTSDVPPFLQDLQTKGTGFSIPEGYFDDLESSVMARLEAAGDLKRPALVVTKRPGLFASFVRPKLLWAAALTLLLAAVWLIQTPSAPINQTGLAATELTEEEIEQYMLENATQFDPVQLAALSTETVEVEPSAQTPKHSPSSKQSPIELRPEDLDHILDEMTDEELEQIL